MHPLEQAITRMNALYRRTLKPMDYNPLAYCDCGWFGDRADARHGECPNCRGRVRIEKGENDARRGKAE